MNSVVTSLIFVIFILTATTLNITGQEAEIKFKASAATTSNFSSHSFKPTDEHLLEESNFKDYSALKKINSSKFGGRKPQSNTDLSPLAQSEAGELQNEQSKPKRKFRRTAGFFGFYGEGIKTSDSQLRNYFGLNDDFKSAYGFANSTLIRFTENVGVLIDTSNSYVRKRNVSLRPGSFNSSNAQIRANVSQSRYDILAGPQYTFANKSRIQPFVYGLAGVELNYQKADAGETLGKRKDLYANFAMAFGGGFDVPVNKLISIRPLQIDYKPVFQRERKDFLDTGGRIEERRLDQTRIAFGIVLNL